MAPLNTFLYSSGSRLELHFCSSLAGSIPGASLYFSSIIFSRVLSLFNRPPVPLRGSEEERENCLAPGRVPTVDRDMDAIELGPALPRCISELALNNDVCDIVLYRESGCAEMVIGFT